MINLEEIISKHLDESVHSKLYLNIDQCISDLTAKIETTFKNVLKKIIPDVIKTLNSEGIQADDIELKYNWNIERKEPCIKVDIKIDSSDVNPQRTLNNMTKLLKKLNLKETTWYSGIYNGNIVFISFYLNE